MYKVYACKSIQLYTQVHRALKEMEYAAQPEKDKRITIVTRFRFERLTHDIQFLGQAN